MHTVKKVHTTQRSQPHKPRGYKQNIRPHNHNDKGKQETRSCRNCGGQLPHTIECPAKGKTYNFCKKHNHFSKVCRSRLKREDFQEVKTKEAIIESSSDEEYAYTIKRKTEHVSVVSTKTPMVTFSRAFNRMWKLSTTVMTWTCLLFSLVIMVVWSYILFVSPWLVWL
jgi:hypothetical protein